MDRVKYASKTHGCVTFRTDRFRRHTHTHTLKCAYVRINKQNSRPWGQKCTKKKKLERTDTMTGLPPGRVVGCNKCSDYKSPANSFNWHSSLDTVTSNYHILKNGIQSTCSNLMPKKNSIGYYRQVSLLDFTTLIHILIENFRANSQCTKKCILI